ncbi:MAG: TonB-dependent receptor [Bacteroidetes bacterium]|nr:TonB-dependent receptor [Bacteroidota bacterium]
MDREILSTTRKALDINLDKKFYGTIAEIGGGQEVARNFFRAGGASGTIAKSISAYDMAYSDALYCKGKKERYVSQDRLRKMLSIEYNELTDVLKTRHNDDISYFVFANTVEAINYNKDNEARGWLGVKFQLESDGEPNEVIIHTSLLENDNLLQQNTLGVLGVNLIYACFYHYQSPNDFLYSLMDNLTNDRLEITMIHMSGPQLNYIDNRLLGVQLVKSGMAKAIMFDRYGKVSEPSDMLYKKNVLAFRGSFRPITYVGFDMLKTSYGLFKKDEDYDKENTIALCEITLNNLLEDGEFHERDFLDRVDILNGMGQNVMVSNFKEYYKLVAYLSQFKTKNLRIVIGMHTFLNVIDEKYYTHLKGGIIEAFGRLFINNMKMYVYPSINEESGELITINNVEVAEDIKYLFMHLKANRKIIDIKNVKREYITTYPHIVLNMIKNAEKGWEKMVPKYIEDAIKTKKLFGYKD